MTPTQYVKPFVKRQKNDRADAETIAEAASRPRMTFLAVKSTGERPPAKAGGFRLRLEAGSVRHAADSRHAEIIVWLWRLLVLNVFQPDLVRYIAARGNPVATRPQVLAPVPLLQSRKLA